MSLEYEHELKLLYDALEAHEHDKAFDQIQRTQLTRVKLNGVINNLNRIESDILDDLDDNPELYSSLVGLSEASNDAYNQAFIKELNREDKRFKRNDEPLIMEAFLEDDAGGLSLL